MERQTDPVIREFIEQYTKDQKAYEDLCASVEKRLRGLLEHKGIMAIVSSRVKDPERLEQKLISLNAARIAAGKGPYPNKEAIAKELHDLVGARIALYFPSDAKRVEELIFSVYPKVDTKLFPQEVKDHDELVRTGFTAHKRRIYPGYENRRFDGYCATHHHVSLDTKGKLEQSKLTIEIQIASLLMHAWSEVEHDLAYKRLMGTVSREEYECLDELNGLVMAGEIALNRLNQLSQQRIHGYTTFDSHYALGAYLSHWQKQQGWDDRPLGNVENLYKSYRDRNVLTTEYLRRQLHRLEKLQWNPDEVLLADRLLDLFTNARTAPLVSRVTSRAVLDQIEQTEDTAAEEQLNKFQLRWNRLENRTKKALQALGQPTDDRTIKLLSIGVDYALTREFSNDFNRLRAIRNKLVYNHIAPSREEMDGLLADIDRLTKFLQTEYGV